VDPFFFHPPSVSGTWKVLLGIGGFLIIILFSGCELSNQESQAIDDAFEGSPSRAYSYVEPPELPPQCTYERYTQPASTITKKLDLLFITDTSGSLNEERAAIAQGIESFLDALPEDVDSRIAVMLAHGSQSAYSGKLWQEGTEPVVLSSDVLSRTELKDLLLQKLGHVASDGASDGGEEGLFSLQKLLSSNEFSEAQSHGFFRDDAAVMIVFIADEQDICAEYPDGVTPVVDAQHIEPVAKANDCGDVSPESVYQSLQNTLEDRPLVVGGVVYNQLRTVPSGGENEYGYGYIDLIRIAGGASIDLADSDYAPGLSSLGSLATVKMNLVSDFEVKGDFDESSLQVWRNGSPAAYVYSSENSVVHIKNPGAPGDVIDISYCEPQISDVHFSCTSGSFVSKTLNVGLSMDPAEGSQNTVVQGLQSLGVSPQVYTFEEVASGLPISDGVSVLMLSRVAVLNPVSQSYIDGVFDYIASGGSLYAEYDAAALLFNVFEGSQPIIQNLNPSIHLFDGFVSGGGALLPIESSTLIVTQPDHPIMQGLPTEFLNGFRQAFAVSQFNASWLDTSAQFISTGFADQVPAGTYPAVMTGRCGQGRVVIHTMNHFQVIQETPVNTMVSQSLDWLVGN
tara:strand:+ start:2000 stop:3874 length:1875 start_codon:yes stop_codon:yes gene_type:complete